MEETADRDPLPHFFPSMPGDQFLDNGLQRNPMEGIAGMRDGWWLCHRVRCCRGYCVASPASCFRSRSDVKQEVRGSIPYCPCDLCQRLSFLTRFHTRKHNCVSRHVTSFCHPSIEWGATMAKSLGWSTGDVCRAPLDLA